MPSPNFTSESLTIKCLPVFPLHMFILPEGRQKLRIFETKYLNMVTQSLNGSGFVIAFPRTSITTEKANDLHSVDKPFPVSHWGTLVRVIDFDKGDDGVLLIDVEGQCLVSLKGIHYQEDDLLIGQCLLRQHWPINLDSYNIPHPTLSDTLKGLFHQYPDLNQRYPIPQFESSQWVNARLLEILPISYKIKAHFIQPDSLSALTTFLVTFIEGQNE